MSKRIFAIFICILLISTVAPAVSLSIKNEKTITTYEKSDYYFEKINNLDDKTKKEILLRCPVMSETNINLDLAKASSKPEIIETPDYFSWKNYEDRDWTTPAKHQGNCGSCWDFAAVGVLESVINIREGCAELDPDLSEQYVLSCLPGAGSCRGGSSYKAFELIKSTDESGNYCNGIITEECMPYQADDDIPCSDKSDNWEEKLVPITDYGYWKPSNSKQDREAIKSQIMTKGPVCAGIHASDTFRIWGALFNDPDDYFPYTGHKGFINHVIVILGWKDDPFMVTGGYWICKNSWGTDWGYDGFFNIAYGSLRVDSSSIIWVDYDPDSYTWPNETNTPPSTPIINGPQKGKIGETYEYTFVTTDKEQDNIYYLINWGDNTNTGWLGPYNSGETQTISHTWNSKGDYIIKIKSKDIKGFESRWGLLSVYMSKEKNSKKTSLKLLDMLQTLMFKIKQNKIIINQF